MGPTIGTRWNKAARIIARPLPAIALCICAGLAKPIAAFAQPCDVLPVDESRYRYRFRDSEPRCEGIYKSPVAGYSGMSLISLTIGKVAYDTKTDRYLEIGLPVEPSQTTLVQAFGIPERLYYRLDVRLNPGQRVFTLSLADVLAHEGIGADALGIYAVRRLPNGKNGFLPVYARSPGAAIQTMILATIRPGADVSDVQWRKYPAGATPTAWAPVAGASGLVPEGRPLQIVLGEDIQQQTTLEVSYLSQGVGQADKFILLER